ncbi:MAG: RidA family protein [Clostridiaceae bacterium]|jgi:2-iminobutanoate/2-iminopropanoate deaminase|nr:RidA family protein [Clostridiaceae bacterium]
MIEYIPFKNGERPFSTAVKVDNMIFVSGQVGVDRNMGKFHTAIEEQTEQAIINLEKILVEQGYSLDKVIKITAILLKKEDIGAFNKIYTKYFRDNLPARTLMVVNALAGEAIVELDAIAAKG